MDGERYGGGLANARRDDCEKKSVRGSRSVRYAGRDQGAAPATGIKKLHKFEETGLLSEALYGGGLKGVVEYVAGVPKFEE